LLTIVKSITLLLLKDLVSAPDMEIAPANRDPTLHPLEEDDVHQYAPSLSLWRQGKCFQLSELYLLQPTMHRKFPNCLKNLHHRQPWIWGSWSSNQPRSHPSFPTMPYRFYPRHIASIDPMCSETLPPFYERLLNPHFNTSH